MAKFRKSLGLAQHRLSKSAGLKRHTIMSYENYQSYPTLDVATKISKALY
ncbi:MAG: helix-turn-helix transcriptional regulator [Bacillota bacterium]|nr:helix-turn-helix transcriptional regulator [Bacillota bacterium]